MSVSDEHRREDKRRTLCLMREQLGDRYVAEFGVEPTDPGFGDVLQTTWRERCTRLARALKVTVKGRISHYDEFVSVKTITASVGLPEGWVHNAVKSRLLGVVFPDDRWDAKIDEKGRALIRVSPTFGLNHLLD